MTALTADSLTAALLAMREHEATTGEKIGINATRVHAGLPAINYAIAETARALASTWTARDRAYLCAIDAVWRNERAALMRPPTPVVDEDRARFLYRRFVVDNVTGERVPMTDARPFDDAMRAMPAADRERHESHLRAEGWRAAVDAWRTEP